MQYYNNLKTKVAIREQRYFGLPDRWLTTILRFSNRYLYFVVPVLCTTYLLVRLFYRYAFHNLAARLPDWLNKKSLTVLSPVGYSLHLQLIFPDLFFRQMFR